MKRFSSGVIFGLILGSALAGIAAETFYKGKRVYVSAASENLRLEPKGKKLGTLSKGTQVWVMEDSEKWVKVSAVGYLWKGSLTGNKKSLGGKPFKAQMIALRSKDEADKVLKKLRAGENFGKLAKEHSVDAISARNNGDLGEFYQGDINPDFEKAVMKLKVGGFSAPVKTKAGYYIFKRNQ